MFNQNQNNEYNRDVKLRVFFEDTDNQAIYQPLKPFDAEVQLFLGNLTTLEVQAGLKDASGAGVTTLKNQLNRQVVDKMLYVCNLTEGYAKKVNDTNLANAVHFTETDLLRMNDGDVLPTVTTVSKLFTPTLLADAEFKKYQIVAQDITDLLKLATEFNKEIGKAAVIDTGANVANDELDKTIDLIHGNLNQMDLLIVAFKAKHPAFVDEFERLRELVKYGVRHNGFEGNVTRGGVAQKGAIVRLLGTNKEATSDANGHYAIIKVKVGTYDAEVTLLDGSIKKVTVKIRKGHIVNVDFDI